MTASLPCGILQMQNRTIAEVKSEELARLNMLSNHCQYCLTELQQITKDKNLNPKVDKTRELRGWKGQPKGLMQVLWV